MFGGWDFLPGTQVYVMNGTVAWCSTDANKFLQICTIDNSWQLFGNILKFDNRIIELLILSYKWLSCPPDVAWLSHLVAHWSQSNLEYWFYISIWQFLFKLQASVGDIFCPRLRGCFNHSVKVCLNCSVTCPDEIRKIYFVKSSNALILNIVFGYFLRINFI